MNNLHVLRSLLLKGELPPQERDRLIVELLFEVNARVGVLTEKVEHNAAQLEDVVKHLSSFRPQ